ncbi:MAG: RluA family pseudouridine synthase [Deltaproteobacteria bacterium]|nr:MAG: RluA family pseudouridine synthase [Deltaproteobacteria bacterium]
MDMRPLLPILYQDDSFIVVNKPAGVMVYQGWEGEEAVGLRERLREELGESLDVIHRLDRATSGVLVLGRQKQATVALSQSFAERRISKRYLALVYGDIIAEGQISTPLTKKANSTKAPLLQALTRFRRLAYSSEHHISLLELFPHTGRRHQLRRHLRSVGHPILGDRQYGYKPWNRQMQVSLRVENMFLHAYALQFQHPISKEVMSLIAPVPSHFQALFHQLDFPLEVIPSKTEPPPDTVPTLETDNTSNTFRSGSDEKTSPLKPQI